MHHVPRFFRRTERMDPKRNRTKPKLERRNAVKHIEYDAASSSSSFYDSSSSSSLITRSLDLADRTSFRVEGHDGEIDRICVSLGLSGPEDFAIPEAAWEARKIRSSSDLLPRSRLNRLDSPESEQLKEKEIEERQEVNELRVRVLDSVRIRDGNSATELTRNESVESIQCCSMNIASSSSSGGGGIKGARPPVIKPPPAMMLKPPPAMTLPAIDNTCSTWDIFRDFAPETERSSHHLKFSSSSDDDEGEEERDSDVAAIIRREQEEVEDSLLVHLSESCSFTTNDDDSSSTTTPMSNNTSPNVRFRRVISPWQKGVLLGRGSFGSVYEGISNDGFFFAVKEVSLLDQGSQGKQSIYQLEQEIALLSQFEHENIVQYLGTEKDESKLYIFLELVTKGSLLSLYHSYHLIDSQVSAYTRQILRGLKYLHDRNVVHRDVKCANILVDSSGSVKLADFGLAKATKMNDVQSCKGTAFWMAPEVVNRKNQGYGLPADIWSLGCTVLEMLTRQIPYSDYECMQALFRIGKGVPPSVPDSLSTDARDFIFQCLQVKPNDRPTAAQLLDHPFVRRHLSTSSGSGSASPHMRPLLTSSGSASPHIGRRS